MKKILGIIGLALVVSVACVFAQSDILTNTGYASDPGWSPVYQFEQDNVGPVYWYTAIYDFGVHGGALGAKTLGPKSVSPVVIPDNMVVMQGIVDVITAVLPATSTNALMVQSAGDLVAAGTTFGSTGIKACVPVDTAGTAIKLTADRNITLTTTGSAATSGVMRVWLKCFRSH